MPDNLEIRARAICAADLDAAHTSRRSRAAAVERYWPLIAAEISRGASDNQSMLQPPDMAALLAEYRRLLGR